jgi:hypothetical protein
MSLVTIAGDKSSSRALFGPAAGVSVMDELAEPRIAMSVSAWRPRSRYFLAGRLSTRKPLKGSLLLAPSPPGSTPRGVQRRCWKACQSVSGVVCRPYGVWHRPRIFVSWHEAAATTSPGWSRSHRRTCEAQSTFERSSLTFLSHIDRAIASIVSTHGISMWSAYLAPALPQRRGLPSPNTCLDSHCLGS